MGQKIASAINSESTKDSVFADENITSRGNKNNHNTRTRTKYFVLAGVLILCVLVACAFLIGYLDKPSGALPPAQFMSEQQLKTELKESTGKSLEEIKKQGVSNSTLPDYRSAEVAGTAYFKEGEYKSAKQALDVAKARVKQSELTTEFYLQYMNVATSSGDISAARVATKELKAKIKSDTSMGEFNQKRKIEQIEMYEKQWSDL